MHCSTVHFMFPLKNVGFVTSVFIQAGLKPTSDKCEFQLVSRSVQYAVLRSLQIALGYCFCLI